MNEARPPRPGPPRSSFERSGWPPPPGRQRQFPSESGVVLHGLPGQWIRPFRTSGGSFSSPGKPGLLCGTIDVRHVFSRRCCSARATTGLSWLDLAEGRLRLDRLSRNGGRIDFLPLGHPADARFAHSSRGKKVSPPPSSAALRPASGCVVDRLRLADRHRGRGGRGLENSKEKRHG